MATGANGNGGKAPIFGQPHSLSDAEAESLTQMILDAQQSSRQLQIPAEDLADSATTQMAPEIARVVDESHIREMLARFNRDYLYGLGRFDEYAGGLLLKWGDGYSRKHIWITVEGENLLFETSHERQCEQSVCRGGQHVYTPEQWRDRRVLNDELAQQFRRPVYERSDD